MLVDASPSKPSVEARSGGMSDASIDVSGREELRASLSDGVAENTPTVEAAKVPDPESIRP